MTRSGRHLIRKLLASPRAFFESGDAYQLLQAYFGGLPLETLRPLLRSTDHFVLRAATFVVSELGDEGCIYLDEVVQLLRSNDSFVRYDATGIVSECAIGKSVDRFVNIVPMLEDEDDAVRRVAMRMLSNADETQIDYSVRFFHGISEHTPTHAQGLTILQMGESVDPARVEAMLDTPDPLMRKYGAIAARRIMARYPHLMTCAESIQDADVRKFCEPDE